MPQNNRHQKPKLQKPQQQQHSGGCRSEGVLLMRRREEFEDPTWTRFMDGMAYCTSRCAGPECVFLFTHTDGQNLTTMNVAKAIRMRRQREFDSEDAEVVRDRMAQQKQQKQPTLAISLPANTDVGSGTGSAEITDVNANGSAATPPLAKIELLPEHLLQEIFAFARCRAACLVNKSFCAAAHLKSIYEVVNPNGMGDRHELNAALFERLKQQQCTTMDLQLHCSRWNDKPTVPQGLLLCADSLTTLTLWSDGSTFSPASFTRFCQTISKLPHLTSLTLYLVGNELNVTRIGELSSAITQLTKLTHLDLDLSSNRIENVAMVQHLIPLIGTALAPKLESLILVLANERISAEAFGAFCAALTRCPKLTKLILHFSFNPIGDGAEDGNGGLPALAALMVPSPADHPLQEIELVMRDSDVGHVSLFGLCTAVEKYKPDVMAQKRKVVPYVKLDLSGNDIGKRGKQALKEMPLFAKTESVALLQDKNSRDLFFQQIEEGQWRIKGKSNLRGSAIAVFV